MNEYDAVVAGGGPAGSAAVCTLARAGLRVLLAHAGGAAEFRIGESLSPQARRLLADLGVLERTLADSHRPSYGNLSAWGGGELESHDFIFQIHGHGLQLDRARFDGMLRHAAAEAGAQVCQPASLRLATGGEPSAPGWHHLHLSTETTMEPIRCRWLIDATGRSSTLSRSLGARRIRTDTLVAIHLKLAPADAGTDEQSSTLVESVEDGWWYTVLLPSGERLVVFLGDADHIDRRALLTTQGFLDRLSQTRHIREQAALHSRLPAAAPHGTDAGSSRLDHLAGDRWLAAGDAALAFDPLSSKGIANALYTGMSGASAIIATEAGDHHAMIRHQQHLEDIFTAYQVHLRQYYAMEQRWPHSPFWQRRTAGGAATRDDSITTFRPMLSTQ